MHSLLASVATRDSSGARPTSRHALTAGVLAVSALLAITATIALPSAARSGRAAAASAPLPPAARRIVRVERRAPAAQLNADADPTIRRFTGRVGPDLSASLAAAGVPDSQGREYVWLLSKAIQITNGLSVEDKFDLIIQRNADGRLGQLLYAGMDRVARADVELMKWTDGKQVIWVNADDVSAETSQAIRMPVQGHITSGFGNRFHPILGYERFHAGVDLSAAAGTPIVAAADGRVLSAGWAGGYGRAVAILHSGDLETKYGHMSRIVAYPGEQVSRGEVIGYVGSSGLSTGPHLHFEVIKNGRAVNPLYITKITGTSSPLEGTKLLAFQNKLRELLSAGAGS